MEQVVEREGALTAGAMSQARLAGTLADVQQFLDRYLRRRRLPARRDPVTVLG